MGTVPPRRRLGLVDGVGVDVTPEGLERAAVPLVDGRPGEAEEAGVRVEPGADWQRVRRTGSGAPRRRGRRCSRPSTARGAPSRTARLFGSPTPASSWNFCTVVITVSAPSTPRGARAARGRFRLLRSGFGNPHAMNVSVICWSRSTRSVTMTMVRFGRGGDHAEPSELSHIHGEALARALGAASITPPRLRWASWPFGLDGWPCSRRRTAGRQAQLAHCAPRRGVPVRRR